MTEHLLQKTSTTQELAEAGQEMMETSQEEMKANQEKTAANQVKLEAKMDTTINAIQERMKVTKRASQKT